MRGLRGGRGVVAAAGLGACLTACGNAITTDIVGLTGVTVSSSGDPVLLVAVCSGQVDAVSVSEGREGLPPDEPNHNVGALTAGQPQSGLVSIDLVHPGPWTVSAPMAFAPDTLYIAYAIWTDHDSETTQVSFRGRQLASLDENSVIVRSGTVWPRDTFADRACG